MKAIKQYFFVELFIILYKLVPKFDSMDERLQYDHSNKTNWEVLSCGAVYYVTHGGSNFWSLRMISLTISVASKNYFESGSVCLLVFHKTKIQCFRFVLNLLTLQCKTVNYQTLEAKQLPFIIMRQNQLFQCLQIAAPEKIYRGNWFCF